MNIDSVKVRALVTLGIAITIGGCTPEPAEEPVVARAALTPSSKFDAYSFEQSPNDPRATRPRVYLKNNTDEFLDGFVYLYYIRTEEGKEPRFTVLDAPGIDVSFERVDGEERGRGDYYRVRYDCTSCPIEPGAIHPNPDGISVEIKNADNSLWNKLDDPSFLDASEFTPNPMMPVYDRRPELSGGEEPDIGWPADEEASDPGDSHLPLPPSLAYVLPELEGQTYTDTVPKTLDLTAMAELSLHGMTQVVNFESNDPGDQYGLMFTSDWNYYPPFLHSEGDPDSDLGKFMGPLVLNRLVSGSYNHLDMQVKILNRYLKQYNDNTGMSGTGVRLYEGLLFNYFREENPNPMWKTLVIQGIQNTVEQLFVPEGQDYGYWPSDFDWNDHRSQDPWRQQLLLQAYKQLDYAPALDAVRKNINWARYESGIFSDDGGIQNEHTHGNPHFHIGALHWQPFLEYALLVNDRDLIDWVKRSYEWARGTSPGSVAALGYFPEFVNEQTNSETCSITDMILTAMQLSTAGIGDYWDDVETYVRNHFAEAQLTAEKAECMENWSRLRADFMPWNVEHELGGIFRKASERSVGGFAGWPTFNAWKHPDDPGIQQCCTGNGARTVYHVWSNIVSVSGNTLRVNLALNRAHRDVDVYSHLPYTGKVELTPKRDFSDVRVRIPGGHRTGVSVRVAGSVRSFTWDGRYVKIGIVKRNQRATVTFPNPTTTQELVIDDQHLEMIKRGSTVVSLLPEGPLCPLYADRSELMSGTAPMQTVTRFASTEPDLYKERDTSWKLPLSFLSSPGSQSGFSGENLLDGDQSRASRWSANGDGKFALFELDAASTVKYVVVATPEDQNGNFRVRRYEVQVAGADGVFRRIFNGSTSGVTTSLEGFDLPNGDVPGVRYVKIIGHGNDVNSLNEFTEFEVWGEGTGPAALLGAEVDANDWDNGFTPGLAYDGKVSTRWVARGDGQWLSFDFGSVRSLVSVQIAVYQGTSRVQYFDIETSRDGENWTLIYKGQSSGKTTAFESYDLPNSATRFVRIVGHMNSRNDENAFNEVRLLGY